MGHCRLLTFIEAEDIAFSAQIHTGAKGLARTGEDDRADGVILAGTSEGIDQLVGHFEVKAFICSGRSSVNVIA